MTPPQPRRSDPICSPKARGQQAAATGSVTLKVHMHKGCTRGAQGSGSQAVPGELAGGKGVCPCGEAGGGTEKHHSLQSNTVRTPNTPQKPTPGPRAA